MSTQNDITGDYITSRPNTKQFEENFDKIFGKKKAAYQPLNQDDEWDEKRTDVIGQNGNDGLHYEDKK